MDFLCEVLADRHNSLAFDSSQPRLDDWLRQSAVDSDGRNLTRTYVWHTGDDVIVGYYTLMPFFIERETLTPKQGRGLPGRISCYLIARLALDRSLHGSRFGSQLLASALARAAIGACDLGGRYVVVDAIDDAAVSFYRHHGFEPIPGRPDRLVLPTKALDSYVPSSR
jgi:GNAT superfamily N-acetyltransferase